MRRRVALILVVLAVALTDAGGRTAGTDVGGAGDRPDTVGLAASAPETVAVAESGVLYLYGNRMEPPYVFVIERDTVRVNGEQFIPPMRRKPAPKITVTRGDTLRHELNVSVDTEVLRLLAEGETYDSIVARAAKMYRISALVDSVHVIDEGTLEVHWHNMALYPMGCTIPRELPPPRPSHVEFLRSEARIYARDLAEGSMIIWKEGGTLTVPWGRISETEVQIRDLKARGWATAADKRRFDKEGVEVFLHPLPLQGGEQK